VFKKKLGVVTVAGVNAVSLFDPIGEHWDWQFTSTPSTVQENEYPLIKCC
jgi:hypothetical protein